MFKIIYNAETGILMATKEGSWEVSTAQAYRNMLIKEANAVHARFKQLRLLVDCTNLDVMRPDVADQLKGLDDHLIKNAGDRVAVITTSSVQKLQFRRSRSSGASQAFLSRTAAEAWLRSSGHERAP